MSKFLSSHPDVVGGKQVIAGTRIEIALILIRLKQGYLLEEIHEMYPQIPLKTLEGAIDEAIETTRYPTHDKEASQVQVTP